VRIFLGIALLLDYEDVNTQFPGSQKHVIYTINLIGLNESYILTDEVSFLPYVISKVMSTK